VAALESTHFQIEYEEIWKQNFELEYQTKEGLKEEIIP
jgi:hypothetical protein